MLADDNIIISTSISDAVEKIPTYEKYYRKYSFNMFYFVKPQHRKSTLTYR